MGIFDDIRKLLGSGGGAAPSPRASSRSDPRKDALRQAQERRRAGAPGLRGNDGKPLTPRRLDKYERLERAVVATAGGFPFTQEQVRAALARQGFEPSHVEAYLRSPAARRLLE